MCAPSKVGQGFLKRNKNYAPRVSSFNFGLARSRWPGPHGAVSRRVRSLPFGVEVLYPTRHTPIHPKRQQTCERTLPPTHPPHFPKTQQMDSPGTLCKRTAMQMLDDHPGIKYIMHAYACTSTGPLQPILQRCVCREVSKTHESMEHVRSTYGARTKHVRSTYGARWEKP